MEMVTIDKICIFLKLSSAVLGLEHGGLQLCQRSSVMSEVFSYIGGLQLYRRSSVMSEVFSYVGSLQLCRRSSVMPVFEFKLLLQMKRTIVQSPMSRNFQIIASTSLL